MFVSDNETLLSQWDTEKNHECHMENPRYPDDPYMMKLSSNKKAWWICEQCGHHWEATIYNRSMRHQGCPRCRGKKISSISKARHAANTPLLAKPLVMKYWDFYRNTVDPSTVSYTSPAKYWFICEHHHSRLISVRIVVNKGFSCYECYLDHEGRACDMPIKILDEWVDDRLSSDTPITYHKRISWLCSQCHQAFTAPISTMLGYWNKHHQVYCPYCTMRVVMTGVNDLATTKPELSKELLHPDEAFLITEKDHHARSWVCQNPECATVYTTTVSQRLHGVDCKRCMAAARGQQRRKLAHHHNPVPKWITDIAVDNDKALINSLSAGNSTVLITVRYTSCGHERTTTVRNMEMSPDCPRCNSGQATSKAQEEIYKYIRSILPSDEADSVCYDDRNVIKPKELDIFIPSRGIAIEYDGLYWHSYIPGSDDEKTGKYHHYDKTEACKKLGIQLIHIFEDDWLYKRSIIESMLATKLGVRSSDTVYARKCTVGYTDYRNARDFADTYQIRGGCKGSVYMTLRHHGIIVALMIVLIRGNTGNIIRYATSMNVPGGFSKLLAHFLRTHEHITDMITFSDHSVSDGSLYTQLGFTMTADISPDYCYINPETGRREHKFGYRIQRFRNDASLTYVDGCNESELAALNGLRRIWDSGKSVWKKQR